MRRKKMDGLGFGDMELFNYAMLAKQTCNLICEPQIFCKAFIIHLLSLLKLCVHEKDFGHEGVYAKD